MALKPLEKCILKRAKCHGCGFVLSELVLLFLEMLSFFSLWNRCPHSSGGNLGSTSAAPLHLALDVACSPHRKRQKATEVSECL